MDFMANPNSEWLLPGLVIVWFAMCGLLSLMSGWCFLAGKFKSDESIEGERFYFRSGAIGWRGWPIEYRNCLFVTVGTKGLALSVLFPFRFLHPRLVIRWSAIERCENVKFWFIKHVVVHVAGFNRRLLFRGDLGGKILAAWGELHGRS